MAPNLKKLALARDIEQAFKNYLNTDSFPTAEWPALALAIADVVVQTGEIHSQQEGVTNMVEAEALVRKLAHLDNCLADLLGL